MRRISLVTFVLTMALNTPVSAEPLKTCPQDTESLIKLMLDDLPSYSNRVIQRAIGDNREIQASNNYVIVAGRPEFTPLPLKVGSQRQEVVPNDVEQVFFTTMERQYSNQRVVPLQNFYWLFLTRTTKGWYMVTLYTQLASLYTGDVPLPPQEVSEGIVGTAIKLWLRDCRAGALR
ncbi:MAG: hypothetical protein RLZZ148_1428 [Cyanobacteriota bacterium]